MNSFTIDTKSTIIALQYINRCIKRIEKSYKYKLNLPPSIMDEICIMYEMTSGCLFMDWLNHRLYSQIVFECLQLSQENDVDIPDYMNWEKLDDESDDET
jgi:hypothetical protein